MKVTLHSNRRHLEVSGFLYPIESESGDTFKLGKVSAMPANNRAYAERLDKSQWRFSIDTTGVFIYDGPVGIQNVNYDDERRKNLNAIGIGNPRSYTLNAGSHTQSPPIPPSTLASLSPPPKSDTKPEPEAIGLNPPHWGYEPDEEGFDYHHREPEHDYPERVRTRLTPIQMLGGMTQLIIDGRIRPKR